MMLKLIYAMLVTNILRSQKPVNDPQVSLDVPKTASGLFSVYVKISGKAYSSSAEYNYRSKVFAENLQFVLGNKKTAIKDMISIQSDSVGVVLKIKQSSSTCDFEMSLNHFFDLSNEEFKQYYLLPPQFFDQEKYNPKHKLVVDNNGTQLTYELNSNTDILNDQPNRLISNAGSSDDQKSAIEANAVQSDKNQIFGEFKVALNLIKSQVNLAKMKKPDDEGLTSSCRRLVKIQSTIKNGVRNLNVSYSQTPSNLDFSQIFSERRLQSAITYYPRYMKQNFENYTDIDRTSVPTFLDWNQISPLTPVKDQKKCNSCYAFSAISSLEAHQNILNNDLSPLAEQEIVDCCQENSACVGGQPYLVYDYVIKNGISYEKQYPYIAKRDVCKIQNIYPPIRFKNLRGYVFPKQGVLNLIKALQYGPIVIVMYASNNLKYYYNGIFEGEGCTGTETPNHAALLYGYNLESSKPYFMLKNNWGPNWGDNGHYKIAIGKLDNSNLGYCMMAETPYNVLPILKR